MPRQAKIVVPDIVNDIEEPNENVDFKSQFSQILSLPQTSTSRPMTSELPQALQTDLENFVKGTPNAMPTTFHLPNEPNVVDPERTTNPPNTPEPMTNILNYPTPNMKDRYILLRYLQHPRLSVILKNNGVSFTPEQVRKMDPQMIQDILEEIRRINSQKYTDQLFDMLNKQGFLWLENLICMYFTDVHGMTDQLRSIPDFQTIMDEVCVEIQMPQVNPMTRLGFLVVQAGILQHSINSISSLSPVKRKLKKEFQDEMLFEESDEEKSLSDRDDDENEQDNPDAEL